MVTVSGIGSWPGANVRQALGAISDHLAGVDEEGLVGMPYLPELPARGPGSDMVGRSLHLLVDMPIDLQPQGWRLVDRPGLDATRSGSLWREDLDELAEVFDGFDGELKLQVVGPWTLAGETWLPLGDRVLSDAGAIRDVSASLAAGVAEHVHHVGRLLPLASVVLQIDEPSLPRVLHGQVPTASGYRRLPAPDPEDASAVIGSVLRSAHQAGAVSTVLHCCATRPPLRVMREALAAVFSAGESGRQGLSVDVTGLDARAWEGLATGVESGIVLWAGAIPTTRGTAKGQPSAYREHHDALVSRWRDVGLPIDRLADVTVTPTCGLAGLSPDAAAAATRDTVDLGRALAETAAS
ncbi:MAG: methionine synthase [Ornithinimicrobium sp.]